MPLPSQFLLYVDDPAQSAQFYGRLLGQEPRQLSPFFALVPLGPGFHLGLWSRAKAEADYPARGESAELCFIAPDKAALEALHAEWLGKGIAMAQAPRQMYFGGWNFVALDPDGHRLRVSTPD